MSQTGLTSFGTGVTAVVVGASGGIGGALTAALCHDPAVARVHAFARRPLAADHPNLRTGTLDLTREETIRAAAETLADSPRLVIVATGLLHDEGLGPEKGLRDLDGARLDRSFAVNAVGPALVMKHLLPRLPRAGKSVFAALSARVGSITDNRAGGWYGYRASKAALNMLLKTAAIETARRHPGAVVAGLHPGTVDTGLSRPFQRGVTHAVFPPERAAAALLQVIDGLGPADSGKVFAWDGAEVDP